MHSVSCLHPAATSGVNQGLVLDGFLALALTMLLTLIHLPHRPATSSSRRLAFAKVIRASVRVRVRRSSGLGLEGLQGQGQKVFRVRVRVRLKCLQGKTSDE